MSTVEAAAHVAADCRFAPGDWIVFRKTKFSTQPGPRASAVNPSQRGDSYSYLVDKFWVVEDVLPNGRVLARTRRGKRHELDPNDIRLRPAGLLDRLLYRRRFLETVESFDSAGLDSEESDVMSAY